MNFVDFYRRFINKFSNIATSFTDILKRSKKEKLLENCEFTSTTRKEFNNLKSVFFRCVNFISFRF